MKKRRSITTYFMYASEIAFLALFFYLFKDHILIKWIFIFAAGLVASLFFSRFYCGWVCPIGTTFKIVNFVYKILGIKKLRSPKWIQNNVVRFTFLVLFIGVFVWTKMMKIKLDVILYAIGIANLVNLFFDEELWHKYMCPYGALLSIFSRKPALKIQIDKSKCVGCGLCQQVCPNNTIVTKENKKREIVVPECLTCFECVRVCPTKAIKYKK